MSEPEIFAVQHAEAILQWYAENGVDEVVSATPVDRLVAKIVVVDTQKREAQNEVAAPKAITGTPEAKAEAERLCTDAQSLDDLKAAIIKFDGLAIKKTAMNLVFSSGNPKAKIMVIGDAPEADDDRAGEAFSGEVGALTDKMFAAIGLNRDTVYLTNVLNWRPPGNRSPLGAEIDISLPFLQRHIALVKPDILFLMGAVAAKSVLGQDATIGKLRGKWNTVTIGGHDYPALATYHPSYLLRTPLKKRESWEDLQMLKERIANT